MKRILIAGTALALLAAPAVGQAKKPASPGCSKPVVNKGFVVKGTLTSFTADDPATAANEESVTITVTKANRHAKKSGELADQDATKPGVQVAGATYTADGSTDTNGFKVHLSSYEAGETPAAGDKVRIVAKVAVTKKRCAPEGTSDDARYGAVNVKRVKIKDAD